MAAIKEIKARITSVRDTQKITGAMYRISSARLRRARTALDNARPYFTALRGEIAQALRYADCVKPWFGEPPAEGRRACLVITADKGLAGAYNRDLVRAAEAMLAEYPDTKLFVIGEYGRHALAAAGFSPEPDFTYPSQEPTLHRAREMAARLLEDFEAGGFGSLYVLYTDMKNSLQEEIASGCLLPLELIEGEAESSEEHPYEFFPDEASALRQMASGWVSGYLYGALVDSFCSEQNARMRAMKTANDNSEELLEELTGTYNRLRQADITQEITEVSAGARAQKTVRNEGSL